MRSLEECKAEIFRRSEEKIKKRKQQRTRILAVCLPLCLCVGALALWGGLGQDDSAVNKSAAPPENGLGLLLAPKEEAAENTVDCMAPELSDSISETVDNPNTGYCGNTMVTAKIRGTEYKISGEQAITLLNILENLQYSPHKICKCLPEYTIVAEAIPYGIHLTQGYARCEAGQAALTREQVQTIQIILQNVVGGDLHSPFEKTDE